MTSPKTFDLGEDATQITYRIGGKSFSVFPLDELAVIHSAALPENGPEVKGEAFLIICRERLKTHGITASLDMSGRWYDALIKAHEEQAGFFVGSPASSDSTGSSPVAAGGDSTTSATTKSDSSNSPRKRSKPKNSAKTS